MKTRIKELRQASGITLLELANKLGVSESTVQRYENGTIKTIKYDTIIEMANIFRCSPAYMMGWDDSNNYAVPVYEAAAGEGRIGDGSPVDEVAVTLEADQVVVRVKGDSMEPTLLDGDLVVVTAQSVIDHPRQIALIKINGDEATLKRVEVKDNGIMLIGDNVNNYAPHFYTMEEVEMLPVMIEGVVTKLIRDL